MNAHDEYSETFIHEIHHIHKLDAPSGTAITLADQIIERINRLKSRGNYSSSGSKLPPTHSNISLCSECFGFLIASKKL